MPLTVCCTTFLAVGYFKRKIKEMTLGKIHHGIMKSTALSDYEAVKLVCREFGQTPEEPKGKHWHKIEDATKATQAEIGFLSSLLLPYGELKGKQMKLFGPTTLPNTITSKCKCFKNNHPIPCIVSHNVIHCMYEYLHKILP